VRLVDDDREPATAMLVADLLQDERELLHRRDDDLLAALDDLLAALDEPAQVPRAFRVSDRRTHLGELLDGVADLAVEQDAIRHHDDGVEHPRAGVPKADWPGRASGHRSSA
jgi:hypothetical protein